MSDLAGWIETGDAAMSAPSVACVLVNWNGWQDTIDCLASLRLQAYPGLRVIVVDNGSTNDSVSRIRAAHPWVQLVETGANLGFPGGCNVGTRLAYSQGADYVWLLNNDTVAPPDTLSRLVATARRNPQAGVVGAILYYAHDPAKVQAWGGGSFNLWTAYVSHFTAPADFGPESAFFTGACMLLPRWVLEQVGILHEGFFMYCDDVDLCLRLHRAGHPLVLAEGTAILHREGASSPRHSPLIDQFATTSTLRLLFRHAPVPAVSGAIYLLLRLGNRLRRREWSNFTAVLHGVRIFLQERNRAFSERL
ncbi:hypothetical protein SAMN05421770_101114 [Granulicella rosea]|uniref:Glycosyltransferase 2-like domain-containing protein n=1 Tax=Granulicella rosea TaxID=474952 RepID=A0A239CW02_9BACT|nr:glycosyltransferase family 2 protein [Granulicella rosea]SNS23714.1 hypothetical protein SAMN05421770_101114 [Granulicella rosea]